MALTTSKGAGLVQGGARPSGVMRIRMLVGGRRIRDVAETPQKGDTVECDVVSARYCVARGWAEPVDTEDEPPAPPAADPAPAAKDEE